MVNLIFVSVAVIGSVGTLLFMRREATKLRARYFAKYGRYPGEPAAKHGPAE
jgi:hypothetical protein